MTITTIRTFKSTHTELGVGQPFTPSHNQVTSAAPGTRGSRRCWRGWNGHKSLILKRLKFLFNKA
jgi:hypothetical protein